MKTYSSKLIIQPHKEQEIMMTRTFNAPREKVFDAWTKPELLKGWLFGPDGHTLAVCEVDLRERGRYRYVWRLQDGTEMGMGGRYLEIVYPERLVTTELFDEDWTGGEAVSTVLLEEQRGQTALTNIIRYISRQARDAVLASPMEGGLAQSYDRLEAMLKGAK